MALQDEIKEEQKKVKDMSLKGKMSYIWDYYKIHIIIGLVIAGSLFVFIRDWVNASRPIYLSAVVLNTILDYEGDSDIASDFRSYASVDSDTYNCTIDTSLRMELGGGDQMTMASEQKILGLFSAKEIDVMMAPEEIIEYYAPESAFIDIRTIMTPDQISAFENAGYPLYYATCEGQTYPAGFYVEKSAYLQRISEHGTFKKEDNPVFAFTSCIAHPEAAIQLLEMITKN